MLDHYIHNQFDYPQHKSHHFDVDFVYFEKAYYLLNAEN